MKDMIVNIVFHYALVVIKDLININVLIVIQKINIDSVLMVFVNAKLDIFLFLNKILEIINISMIMFMI